jgi:hypothetical protein
MSFNKDLNSYKTTQKLKSAFSFEHKFFEKSMHEMTISSYMSFNKDLNSYKTTQKLKSAFSFEHNKP